MPHRSILPTFLKQLGQVCAFVFIACGFSPSALAEIRSELQNPFRFFRHVSDYAVHRIAFDSALFDLGTSGDDFSKSSLRSRISINDIERRLSSIQYWTKPIDPKLRAIAHWPSDWNGKTPLEIIETLRAKEKKPTSKESRSKIGDLAIEDGFRSIDVIERYGWAALLDVHLAAVDVGVCWDRVNRKHCDDFTAPKYWTVRLFDSAAPAGNCVWTIDSGAKFISSEASSISASCAEIYIDVSANKSLALGDPKGAAHVRRTDTVGNVASVDANVSDRLILGLGDSYTSGEGNPDRPVILSDQLVGSGAAFPRRPRDGEIWAAQWIDRSCHRSAYSWQLRLALHQTLIDPSKPITFLSFTCSGAEIVEGLFYPWRGPEPTKPLSTYSSQLAAVYEELCADSVRLTSGNIPKEETDDYIDRLRTADQFPWKSRRDTFARDIINNLHCKKPTDHAFTRRIDAVLLGIGGNDVGFARWIVGAITDGGVQTAGKGFIPALSGCGSRDRSCLITQARLERLESRFSVLRQVMLERLIPDGGLSPDRVFVTGYPKAVSDAMGNVCPEGNSGMTISVWPGRTGNQLKIRDSSELKTIEKFRDQHLMRLVRDFALSSEKPFKFITDHIKKFNAHGFCATSIKDEAEGDDYSYRDLYELQVYDDKNIIETLHMPRLGAAQARRQWVTSPNLWRPFRPSQWRPYAFRTRWLRTPNDVFMTVNNKSSAVEEEQLFGLLDLRNRGTSGSFHPTAEAHSIIADSIVAQLLEAIR